VPPVPDRGREKGADRTCVHLDASRGIEREEVCRTAGAKGDAFLVRSMHSARGCRRPLALSEAAPYTFRHHAAVDVPADMRQ